MKRHQKGAHTVEFAIVGSLFFVLLFAVLEFGRMLLAWNTLTEATRRGARIAVVCPDDAASIVKVKNVAVFNTPDATSDTSPIVPGLVRDMVTVEYPDGFVRVRISGYQHFLLIPFIAGPLNPPDGVFVTTLPRESMGCVPDANGSCAWNCP